MDSWYKGHRFSWYEKQEVYYKDKAINRHSPEYDNLITAAFDARKPPINYTKLSNISAGVSQTTAQKTINR